MIKLKFNQNIAKCFSRYFEHKNSGFAAYYLLIICFLFSISFQSNAQFRGASGSLNKLGVGQSSQKPSVPTSKAKIKKDTVISVIPDSLKSKENQLSNTVEYTANDSTIMDVDGETVHLYGEASVVYGDIELKADYIQLNWGKNEVFAHGLPDTTKSIANAVKGKPIFTQSGDNYNTDTIRYNFKSKKAIIKGIVTQQGEGYVQGQRVKKDSVDNLYLVNGKYTTCNLLEPHFHIAAKKIKLVDKKSVVSGPFNFVLADIPLPIGLPFGFFPLPKKQEIGTSGFIMGNYGEEPANRGFYFRDFGYYHAFNEYIGAKVLAQLYSRGSWGIGVQSNYTKNYKYSGNVNLQFNYNKPGQLFSTSSPSRDFNISWSHNPQNKRPDRSFSSSVNLVSNGFNSNNRRLDEVDQYTNSAFSSSIQYSRSFGKLVRTSSGFRADQNVSTQVFNSSLDYSIGIQQFNPFVPEKKQIGKWYESFRVGLDVSGGLKLNNQISTRSTTYTDYNVAGVLNSPVTNEQEREKTRILNLLSRSGLTTEERASLQAQLKELNNPVLTNLSDILNNSVFNTSYTVPISLPNFKIAKYINLTPSISYRGDLFTKELNYKFANPTSQNYEVVYTKNNGKIVTVSYDPSADSIRNTYDDKGNLNVNLNPNSGGVVIVDTTNKLAFGQSYSFGTSLNTRFYGTYRFGKKSRIQAIRHTAAPSISLSYTPDSEGQYARKVQVRQDTAATFKYLPRFLNSSGGSGSASGNISFGISNQLEAKIRAKSDTSENEFEKVSLLDNFSINSSYNMLAKKELGEYALSNFNIGTNTSLFKGLISLNLNGTLDPYAYVVDDLIKSNLAGRRITVFKWNKGQYSGSGGNYLSNANFSLSSRLTPQLLNKNKKKPSAPIQNPSQDPAREAMEKFVKANPMAYVDFSIPWSLGISYTFSYYKQGLSASQNTQTVQFTGDFSLTPKWKFTYNTGWDFETKSVTLTNIGVIRELHCWDMSFNWTPIAGNNLRASNYNFTIRPRSSLLQDLKISRRRQYYDRGGF